ncbi:MAG: peptide chain release factor N(5)-glutamine methyltransferase [Gammaproteobacteria bacterium]|nr:peptide chain release factor N(5)-glutamine methyltransferase [Gammaproteobacteria bacterium]
MSISLSIKDLISGAEKKFNTVSYSARLDAELLLIESLNRCEQGKNYSRSFLRTWPDKIIESKAVENFHSLCQQRLAGKPIAYILGHQSFWHFDLKVTEDTLIPRPDTETLIETALTHLPDGKTLKILDLGTGSGAIALALAYERPFAEVYATDIYLPTARIAQSNREQNNIQNLSFIISDWLSAFKPNQFDMIVSNPPYIDADDDKHLKTLKYEPSRALISKNHGLSDCQTIIQQAKQHLKQNGMLILEHGYDQAKEIYNFFQIENYQQINQQKDLANIIRVSYAKI